METILITGGSRGIGKAACQEFLKKGWKVVTSSTTGRLDFQDKNLTCFQLDLSVSASIQSFTTSIGEIQIRALLNNAGIVGDFYEKALKINTLRKVLEVNLIGLADLTDRLLGRINRGGCIINLSSGMGTFSEDIMDGWVPSYRISKAALNMYSRTLAAQLKPRGIQVCAYEPGWVKTDMGGDDASRDPAEVAVEIWNLLNDGFESGAFYGPDGRRNW